MMTGIRPGSAFSSCSKISATEPIPTPDAHQKADQRDDRQRLGPALLYEEKEVYGSEADFHEF
jgi:hypothetical protein